MHSTSIITIFNAIIWLPVESKQQKLTKINFYLLNSTKKQGKEMRGGLFWGENKMPLGNILHREEERRRVVRGDEGEKYHTKIALLCARVVGK